MHRARIFIAYAKQDQTLFEELRSQLKSLEIDGTVDVFFDGLIEHNQRWDVVLQNHLREADIVLFLLSPDFFASDYVMQEEVPPAMLRHDASKAVVVPILIRDCMLPAMFSERNCLMSHDNKAIASGDKSYRDKEWRTVAEKVAKVAVTVNARSAAREAGMSTLSLKEVKTVLERQLQDASSVCLCSRTGMGWNQDLRRAIRNLSEPGKHASCVHFLFLDPDGDVFKLDSSIHYNPAQFPDPAYSTEERREKARAFYYGLRRRGHQVRVTNVFLPQAFWAIAHDGSARPNNAYIEVPVWPSHHGGNLYIEAEGTNDHVMAYTQVFIGLWNQAKEWPASDLNEAGSTP